jgi:hypothetical protein
MRAVASRAPRGYSYAGTGYGRTAGTEGDEAVCIILNVCCGGAVRGFWATFPSLS